MLNQWRRHRQAANFAALGFELHDCPEWRAALVVVLRTTAEVETRQLVVIDGGAGQVGVAKKVLEEYGLNIPLVGLAKGPDRKQDVPVYDGADHELARTVHTHKKILQHVRDESHRFAVGYHRKLRAKKFIQK